MSILLSSSECLKVLGNPNTNESKYMVLFDVPSHLEYGLIPRRIYCNKFMIFPLLVVFQNLIQRGYVGELTEWNGCFNIRGKKSNTSVFSLHAWGLAIDVNAKTNAYGAKPALSEGFVKCFTDAGFDWGGVWAKPDGMHFQLKRELVFK